MNLQRSKGGEEGKGREGRKREGGREGKGGEREGAESRECVYVLCVILNIIADEQNKQPSKKTGKKKRDSNRPRPQPFLPGFAERRSHEDEKAVTREESYVEKSTVRHKRRIFQSHFMTLARNLKVEPVLLTLKQLAIIMYWRMILFPNYDIDYTEP